MPPWKIPAYATVAAASIACAALQPGHACGLAPAAADLVTLAWAGEPPASADPDRQAVAPAPTGAAASAALPPACPASSCP